VAYAKKPAPPCKGNKVRLGKPTALGRKRCVKPRLIVV
jgi:hypothetical protein